MLRALAGKPKKKVEKIEKAVVPPPVIDPIDPPELAKKVQKKDVETGKVVETFDSVEAAVEAGYSLPNLKGAIKNGTKYKGHHWSEVE